MPRTKDLLFVILQFLNEENFKETAHMLERETAIFFDLKYFEDLLLGCRYDEAERYLSGFTAFNDNANSTKIYFEMRKLKYYEALGRHDKAKALQILLTDLKVFSDKHEEVYKDLTQLLTLNDIREHPLLSNYTDAESARAGMAHDVKLLILRNPLLTSKLSFPDIKNHRLRRLINQSLNWQHIRCTHPLPNPDIKTLFVDHVCQPNALSCNQPNDNSIMPCEDKPGPVSTPLSISTSGPSTVTYPTVAGQDVDHIAPEKEGSPEDSSRVSAITSETRATGPLDKVLDDLPKTVVQILNEHLPITSMDFHPLQQTSLLVGNNIGDLGLWDVSSGKKLVSRNFKVWNIGACSGIFKAAFVKDACVSVNRLLWAPNGSLFGVAYTKHIVQLYHYFGGDEAQKCLEIDAHIGCVNDLAFAEPFNQLLLVTCGDDKIVKVWEVTAGAKLYSFEGHEASVYSVCPIYKENTHFILSTSVDGTIKAWLYDTLGIRVNSEAPGCYCRAIIRCNDEKRLFFCGASRDRQSYIVEWSQSDGRTVRSYQGLQSQSLSVMQFDTGNDQYLAAGDDYQIKIWNMDHEEILTTVDADGDLPASPFIRFNKDGTLLAVTTSDNRIKVLASDVGLKLLQTSIHDAPRVSECLVENVETANLSDLKLRITGGINDNVWKLFEVSNSSQFRSFRLRAPVQAHKISRLIYSNAGKAILALDSNAIHLLWRWPSDSNDQATIVDAPQFWQPKSGKVMYNDTRGIKLEEAIPCCALSKNDSYLISGSGGKISVFNILAFTMLKALMPPPPAVTTVAFHPRDNNEIALGREDATIMIYNVRKDEVKRRLEGHSKGLTSLAFSNALNILVSAGEDAQIIVWNAGNWAKQKNIVMRMPVEKMKKEMPVEKMKKESSYVYIQFFQDQIHLLAVRASHLAIFKTVELECVNQWIPGESSAPITHGVLSCDSRLVYASFRDGSVSIFCASDLQLQCRINPTAYLSSVSRSVVYPVVIAAHPKKPHQVAVGLSNGEVHIFEPLGSIGKWNESAGFVRESPSNISQEDSGNSYQA